MKKILILTTLTFLMIGCTTTQVIVDNPEQSEKIARLEKQVEELLLEREVQDEEVEVELLEEEVSDDIELDNSIIYENTKHGFTLNLTKEWKGYKVVEDAKYLSFEVPTNNSFNNNGYHSVFKISIYNKSDWQLIQSEEGLKATYLGENDNGVFAYSVAQAMPSDLEAVNFHTNEVLDTFKINN